jgi:hypothetical protein
MPNASTTPASGKSWFKMKLLWLAVVGICLWGLFELWGSVGTARNAVARVRCQENLKLVYPALVRFVEQHGHVPVDDEGNFSLRMLVEGPDSRLSLKNLEPCEGHAPEVAYLAAPGISSGDFERGDGVARIVLFDRPGNHLLLRKNGAYERRNGVVQEQALFLYSNGMIRMWYGNAPDYAAWVEQFSKGAGEPFPPGVDVPDGR